MMHASWSPTCRALVLCNLLIAASVGQVQAQVAPHIVVGPNVPVRGDTTLPHIEPHLATNPRNANNMIAASVRADSSWYSVVALASQDGGRSWTETQLAACDFDPWVIFLPSGDALLSCLGRVDGPTPVYVFRSADGGRNWSGPSAVPLGQGSFDRSSMVADTTFGDSHGTVYLIAMQATRTPSDRVLSGPAVSRSLDGGRSFSDALRLQTTNVWANVLNPVVLPDGRMGFGFIDYAVDAPGDPRAANVRELRTPRTWWVWSNDDGESLSLAHLMAEVHEISSGHITVDASDGPFRNRLYYVMDDFRDGNGGVFVLRSLDSGETWSDATRVSRDSVHRVRRLPTAAVNGRGELLVAWFEPRGTDDRRCWQLMAAASFDGGSSLQPAVPVAEVESCNNVPGNAVRRPNGAFNVSIRWPAGGDYFGLIALPDNSFRALWPDSRTGVFQLWMADIELRAASARETSSGASR